MTASLLARFVDRSFDWLSTSGLRVIVIVIGMAVLLAFVKRGVDRFRRLYAGALPSSPQVNRADTLTHVIRDVARVVILVVGGMVILSELSVDLKPLLAAAGRGGLAIGFGG